MQFCLLILGLLSGIARSSEGHEGKHWAVLVAGSDGWDNYRHQADVCHAYQLLRKNGIPPENIITMMYDDVANNRRNPFPGKLFNDYKHVDVYAGVKIDYRGKYVTPDMFLRVLKGDRKLKESGFKVLESGPEDNVFIYFSDHGSPNTIEFPSGELSAKQLNETLAYMNKARLYKKMVIYIEACYSGSMFRRILPENIDILAVTAAHEDESSWATFCDDPKIDTCLADEFSYQWLTDTEKHQRDLSKWTVGKQFRAVKQAVKKSHVMRYGDWGISSLSVGEFQANVTRVGATAYSAKSSMTTRDRSVAIHAHLVPLMHQLKRSKSSSQMELAQRRLLRALELCKMVKETVDEIVEEVTTTSAPTGTPIGIHEHLDCYQTVYAQYKNKCFTIQQVPEVAKEMVKLDHLCEQGYDANVIVQAIFTTCG